MPPNLSCYKFLRVCCRVSTCPLTLYRNRIRANIEAWRQTRNFVHSVPITSPIYLTMLKTVQVKEVSEFILSEQLVSPAQHQTNTENEVNTKAMFDESLYCEPTRQHFMEKASPAGGNDGDNNDPNCLFFRTSRIII